jgi:LacI family transcriptional regulator
LNLDWGKFACVALGFSLQEPQVHRVAHNHFRSMVVALERIHRGGYQRVGLVMNRTHDARVDWHWSAAFLGFKQGAGRGHVSIFDAPADVKRLLAWFRREKPEVIISDILTVPSHLESAGYRIPADYCFVHLNRPTEEENSAGIDQHSERVGEAAVKQLVAALHVNESGLPHVPDTTLVCGEWSEGLSLPERDAARPRPVQIAPLWEKVQNLVLPRSGIEEPEVLVRARA